MQESFRCWQCSDRYIISLFPHLHTPSPFSQSLISLMVSVDVKHCVYLLASCQTSGAVWKSKWLPWAQGLSIQAKSGTVLKLKLKLNVLSLFWLLNIFLFFYLTLLWGLRCLISSFPESSCCSLFLVVGFCLTVCCCVVAVCSAVLLLLLLLLLWMFCCRWCCCASVLFLPLLFLPLLLLLLFLIQLMMPVCGWSCL